MDFARLLVSTPNIEIVNKSLEFFIDGTQFDIKLVEEWGCLLGEDAFLTEVESESTPEVLAQPNDVDGLDEVQGEWELDDLVNDLHKEWSHHDLKKDVSDKSDASATKIQAEIEEREDFFAVNLSSVSQPVAKATRDDGVMVYELKQVVEAEQPKVTSTMGPWSIEWLSLQKPITEGGVVFTSSCKAGVLPVLPSKTGISNSSSSTIRSKKKMSGHEKNRSHAGL